MRTDFRAILFAAITIVQVAPSACSREVDFATQIAPIFKTHCLKCHGPEKQQGGLRFDSASGAFRKGDSDELAIAPGKAEASELIRRVTSDDESTRMPPKGNSLSHAEIELLNRWIDAGAKWPELGTPMPESGELVVTDEDRRHWSFRPLQQPPVPTAKSQELVRTPIDAFIVSALEEQGLRLTDQASPRTLIRRIKMGLIGLPPTPEEIASFEHAFKDDPQATSKLVEAYLGTIHYGERWGRHWLDVARYADSHGQEGDQDRPYAFRYRDFVIQAFNSDMPFDQFARWQIAGNELAPEDPLAVAATGFLAAGPSTELKEEPLEKEKARGRFIERMRNRYNELDDVIATLGTGMLGLTLGCARCHDHKFDAIPTRDYYRLLSAFHSGNRGNVFLGTREETEAYELAHSQWAEKHHAAKQTLDEWLAERRRALEPGLLEGRLRGLNLTAAERTEAEKELLSNGSNSNRAKTLAAKHSISLKISEQELAAAMTPDQRSRWNELKAALRIIERVEPPAPAQAFVYRDTTNEPRPTWLFPRGDFESRSEPVGLGFLTVLTKSKPAEEYWRLSRSEHPTPETTYQRTALADWLTDVEDGAGALVARVIVNRVWQHHFGKGLVRTPDDFGVQGEKPTHPELLEWLASDFVENGWRLKRLHRLTMTSAAYSQDITFDEASARIDAENRLLWRREPMRLEAEALRDAMLFAAGTLNLKPYGPGFKPPIPKEAMVARNLQSPYESEPAESANVLRRSVYMFHKRVIPHPLMELFDRPASSQSCGRREQTLVAPQALTLLNDPFVRSQAEQFARRLVKEREETRGQVRLAFETSLARPPEDAELAAGRKFISIRQAARQRRDASLAPADVYRAALADYCQVLFGLNEFLYID
jgi:mono/diheme cytochrome c family protein